MVAHIVRCPFGLDKSLYNIYVLGLPKPPHVKQMFEEICKLNKTRVKKFACGTMMLVWRTEDAREKIGNVDARVFGKCGHSKTFFLNPVLKSL